METRTGRRMEGTPGGTTRNTHRGGREGREEPKGRSENRHRPDLPGAPRTHAQGTEPAKAVVAHSATQQLCG